MRPPPESQDRYESGCDPGRAPALFESAAAGQFQTGCLVLKLGEIDDDAVEVIAHVDLAAEARVGFSVWV